MKAKLTKISGHPPVAANRPMVCFIPGGPGISSATLRSMDILARSFDLVYVDTPGCGGLKEPESPTFYSVVESIRIELSTLNRPLIICGHSFGALLGIELAKIQSIDVTAFVAMASPLSSTSYGIAAEYYQKNMTPQLKSAADAWALDPIRKSLNMLLASYDTFYFSPKTAERGAALLKNDLVSPKIFKALLPVISRNALGIDFVRELKNILLPKYFIGAELDLMFPPESLQKDAQASGCIFREVKDAGHFVTFDQPEAVAGLFEEFFIDSKKTR